MSKALYHQTGKAALEVTIAKKHADGTVDLAIDGVVKITQCQISENGAPGTCTLGEATPKKGKGRKAKEADAKDDEPDADTTTGDHTDDDDKLDP